MRVLKNLIEIQPDDNAKSLYIHRDNIAGLRCYKNHPINDKGEYIIIIYLIHPINDREDFVVGCTDVEKYIEWFDDDERVEIQKFFENTLDRHKHTAHKLESVKHVVRDTCKCCREELDSVSERPEFNNDFFCDVCYDAKTALASLDNKTTTIVKEDN